MVDKYWKKIERKFSKKLNAERQWLSRGRNGCEDVVGDKFVMDVKSTKGKNSITIKRDDLEEIVKRGRELGKVGVLGFQFYMDRNQYVVLHIDDFKRLMGVR